MKLTPEQNDYVRELYSELSDGIFALVKDDPFLKEKVNEHLKTFWYNRIYNTQK